jgi:hypothetical protein
MRQTEIVPAISLPNNIPYKLAPNISVDPAVDWSDAGGSKLGSTQVGVLLILR